MVEEADETRLLKGRDLHSKGVDMVRLCKK